MGILTGFRGGLFQTGPSQAGMPYALSPLKGKIQPDIKQARLGHGRGQIGRVADDIRPGHIKIEPTSPPAQPQGRARQVATCYAIAVLREHMTEIKRGVNLKGPQHPGQGDIIRQPQRQFILHEEPAIAKHHRFPQPPHRGITAIGHLLGTKQQVGGVLPAELTLIAGVQPADPERL